MAGQLGLCGVWQVDCFPDLPLLMMMMMTRNKRVLPIRQHPHVADDLQ